MHMQNYRQNQNHYFKRSTKIIRKFIYRPISEISHIKELEWGTYRIYNRNRFAKFRYQIFDKHTHRNLTKFISYRRHLFYKMIQNNCSTQPNCQCKFCILSRKLKCKQPALCTNSNCNFKRRELIRKEKQMQNNTMLNQISKSTQTKNNDESELMNENVITANEVSERANEIITETASLNEHNKDIQTLGSSEKIDNSDANDSGIDSNVSMGKENNTSEIIKGINTVQQKHAETIKRNTLMREKKWDKGSSGIPSWLRYVMIISVHPLEDVEIKSGESKIVPAYNIGIQPGDKVYITRMVFSDYLKITETITSVNEHKQLMLEIKNTSDNSITINAYQEFVKIAYLEINLKIQANLCNTKIPQEKKILEKEFENKNADDSGFLDLSMEQEPQENEFRNKINEQNKSTPEKEKILLSTLKNERCTEGHAIKKIKLRSCKEKHILVESSKSFEQGDIIFITPLENIDVNLSVAEQIITVDKLGQVNICVKNISKGAVDIKRDQKLIRMYHVDPIEYSDLISKHLKA